MLHHDVKPSNVLLVQPFVRRVDGSLEGSQAQVRG